MNGEGVLNEEFKNLIKKIKIGFFPMGTTFEFDPKGDLERHAARCRIYWSTLVSPNNFEKIFHSIVILVLNSTLNEYRFSGPTVREEVENNFKKAIETRWQTYQNEENVEWFIDRSEIFPY